MRERFPRAGGILLHPTSLPGPWGIGDLGQAAYDFVDFLTRAGQRLWQILPLVPTGYGNSPYQSPSAFAGNPLLISLERLVDDGLLETADLYSAEGQPLQWFEPGQVDYDAVVAFKQPLLRAAHERFRAGSAPAHQEAYEAFCDKQAFWLDDYALFVSITEKLNAPLEAWEQPIAARHTRVLTKLRRELEPQIAMRKFEQYLFFSQWQELKAYANEHEIKIIGDAPIFVAYNSAEVWANPELFYLDKQRTPTVVAGVPPDFFSATGQRWGNPLYRWDKMAANGYAWWKQRMRTAFETVDILRLDHFRGFAAYWEIKADEETAVNGKWTPGPGMDLFRALADELGDLPIIAEDLGVITPDVEELRDGCNLPGMKVLQFAFGDDAKNPYLPHNYVHNSVVYTGTHDNDTTLGWFLGLPFEQQETVRRYLGHHGDDIAWDLMRLAYASVADMAIMPLQDVLRLGSDARQNTPGTTGDPNWTWRYHAEQLDDALADGLRIFTKTYRR